MHSGPPTLTQVASTLVRYGGLTFGGGMATVAALDNELVRRRGWLTTFHFRLAYALSRLTPGTNLLAFCTALGWQMRGVAGAFVALAASSLPCSAFAVLATVLLESWQDNRVAMFAIQGASAAAIGIVGASCWQLIEPHTGAGARLRTCFLVLGAIGLHSVGVPPIRVLLLAAVLGGVWRERE